MVKEINKALFYDIWDKHGLDVPHEDLVSRYVKSALKLCGDTCVKILADHVLIDNNFGVHNRGNMGEYQILFTGCTCHQIGNNIFSIPNIGITGKSGTACEFVEEKESFQTWSP